MAWTTLSSEQGVRFAGNISERVPDETLRFYLEIASYFLYAMIGSDNYASARGDDLDAPANDMLTKAESMIAVSFALPAVALHFSEMGAVKQMAMARGGEYQTMSFAKEIQEIASSYMILARSMIPATYLVDDEKYKTMWHNVAMMVFPGLNEYPTRGSMHSWAEVVIQEARGDELYVEEQEGID